MKVFIVLATVLACAFAKPGFAPVTYNSFGVQPFAPYTTYAGYSPVAAYNGYTPYTTAYTAAAAPAVHYSSPVTYTAAAAPVAYTGAPVVAAAVPAFTKTQYHSQNELGEAAYGYSHPGQSAVAHRDASGAVRGSYAYVNPEGQEIRVNYIADQAGYRAESNALPVAPVHIVPAAQALPVPVADTPEVVEARAAHAQAHAEALTKASLSRKKRGVVAAAPVYSAVAAPVATYSTYSAVHHPALTYSGLHHPVAYTAGYAAPALAYSAGYAAPTVAYSAGLHHPLTYSVAPVAAVREATLTKVVNTPNHAVSYRVD